MSAVGHAQLLTDALGGEQRAIARLLSIVQRSLLDAADIVELAAELPRTGRAIGLVGPPGVGKSTLLAAIVEGLLAQDRRVAVLANDPTGAETGGALLGDRLRMKSLSRDPRVFIRSIAARDPLRSLNETTFGAVALLTRLGFDDVLVEAVGAGQSDIGTSLVTDTTVLVLVPGLGDDVQAIKSGLGEVADVIVINKFDLPEAKRAVHVMRQAMKLMHPTGGWVPPVIPTSAIQPSGIEELLEALDRHREASAPRGDEVVLKVLLDLVLFEVARRLRGSLPADPAVLEQLRSIAGRDTAVLRAALVVADGIRPLP
jgi:LAO/AO transport system kinase